MCALVVIKSTYTYVFLVEDRFLDKKTADVTKLLHNMCINTDILGRLGVKYRANLEVGNIYVYPPPDANNGRVKWYSFS